MAAMKARLEEFNALLGSKPIDMKKLNQLCFQGCPDKDGIRATCWKLLLGYLPPNPDEWDKALEEQRSFYSQLVDEVLINPHSSEQSPAGEMMDHPLNPNPESSWHRFFEDNSILLQIDNDTRRLYPDMSFFQLPTPYPQARYNAGKVMDIDTLKSRVDRSSLPSEQVATTRAGIRNVRSASKNQAADSAELYSPLKEGEEAHWEVVERLLFLYAKTNKGIGYVQGMNEIIGPIYYVFAQHPDPKWKAHAEADTFFCFTNLMTEIGDKFTKKLDFSQAGIGGAMNKMMNLIKAKDPALHKHMVKQGIDPTFFGFRWITLMLSQEFLLPDVIRLWDSFFSDEKRFKFVIYFCAAMIVSIRTNLLAGDFSECVKLLLNYPLSDTQSLLRKAQDIQRFHTI